MSTFAHVVNGKVVNLSVADPEWSAPDWINIDTYDPQPWIGCTYDAQTDTFSTPAPLAPTLRTFVKWADFMDQWELTELGAFYTAKRTDPMLEAFEEAMKSLGGVRLGSSRAASGKAYLVQQGILTQERADILFAQ